MARCFRSPLLVALLAATLFAVDAANGRHLLSNAALERQIADIIGAANAAVRGLRPAHLTGRKLLQNEDCSTYVQGCDLTAVQDDCSAQATCLKTLETEASYQQCVCAATCQARIEVYQCGASYYSCAVKCYAAGTGSDGCKDCSAGNLKAGSFYTFCQCTAAELTACTTYATDKLNTTLWNDCNRKYYPEWFGPVDRSPYPTIPSAPTPDVEPTPSEEPAPTPAEEPTPSAEPIPAEEPTPSEEPTPAPEEEEPMPSEGPAPVPAPSHSETPTPSGPVQYGPQLACGYGIRYGYSYGYAAYGYGYAGYGASYGYGCELVSSYAA